MLRKLIEHALGEAGITDRDAYICSLSTRTVVYKGQLTPEQVTPAFAHALGVGNRLLVDRALSPMSGGPGLPSYRCPTVYGKALSNTSIPSQSLGELWSSFSLRIYCG